MIEYPVIPSTIVVHLGAPGDDAPNVTETFQDYIKNVASSEIYPTWPDAALRANIYAQISVAMNRVYTEYYRSRGYDFDITSSPAYDQNYVYQRDIYSNISEIVDEIFNSYLKRPGNIEPLFATFCDGIRVNCNGLSQWGTVTLAEEGRTPFEILQYYYGDNLLLVENVPIADSVSSSPIVPLKEGDVGAVVELLQRRLNRISANFPAIPKIPRTDAFFGKETTDAVETFQRVFGLDVDGIVGKNTWYSVQSVYNAVKKIDNLNSEGISLPEASTQFDKTLERGDISVGVLSLQYYLDYIATYVPTVRSVAVDGVFGPDTQEAVKSFQRTYGLEQNGEVDRLVWDKIQNVYYGLVESLDYLFREGEILPYPGRVLRVGLEGDDVRVMQSYLSYIADAYPDIPQITPDGIFGTATEAAVLAFQNKFDLAQKNGRVGSVTWDAIVNIYKDLYAGRQVAPGQYPGYTIRMEE